MKRQIPYHGWCFVCGPDNPNGIGITMFVDDDGVLTSEFTLNETHQGPPGHTHGGASAAILDEIMGLVVWAAGHKVVAANININYRKMLPLHQPLLRRHASPKLAREKSSAKEKLNWQIQLSL
ncbi:PaaI family thioesterase [Candidatus Villigracilis affinis]|uniref:PaaI family thioesterase n=1 Tax=Candidatus Villigracilis affinis TaxID=3140682 RepID=UPI002A1FBCB1|nr:PaaI family thioesterase [Anaerolineales bacterium]